MRRLWPQTLAGRLILLLVLTLFVAQLVVLAISASDRLREVASAQARQASISSIAMVRLLEMRPASEWPELVQAFKNRTLSLQIAETALVERKADHRKHPFARGISRNLPDGFGPVWVEFEVARFFDTDHWRRNTDRDDENDRARSHHRSEMMVSIALSDDRFLNLRQRVRPPPVWAGITWGYFLLSVVLISLVAWLAVRRLTRPLRQLADATERFGRGDSPPELPIDGPAELRKAAMSFNEMATRIHRFVGDRTAMIAAISHDLRTPITSLRLRAEFIEDDENRERMLATLDEMTAMTTATLDFVRDDAKQEAMQSLDLAATLESLADDAQDLGQHVEIDELERQVVQARPTALRRALRNLIDNAVRYGGRARITMDTNSAQHEIMIAIDDFGPGIPEHDMARVFEPFARLEASRNLDTGGTGLGLAIARTIIRGHGGDISLKNRKDGLRVAVTLPLQTPK